MAPKEKAKELFERFENAAYNYFTNTGDGIEVVVLAKQSSLIAVDEILKELPLLEYHPLGSFKNPKIEYWGEVKQEIEKI